MKISFDTANFFQDKVGSAGLRRSDLTRLAGRLDTSRKELKQSLNDRSLGYLSMPERHRDIRESISVAEQIARKYKTLIVLGIGGSDLGARMLVQALGRGRAGMDIRFLGANTDPEEIAAVLSEVDLKRCAINIVSKSGGTIEPMSTFLLLRDKLIKQVGKKKHVKQIIATTDDDSGTMRAIANREGYQTLSVPDDIGGRFSALTPVGLFPAACAGVPVRGLLHGMRTVRDDFFRSPARSNSILKFAGLHYLGYSKQNRNITVLMPYAARLELFGRWFRQLWAESLGKRQSCRGRTINVGLTPVAALGAADQHSQVQLYNEGPQDKLITFIEVEKLRQDFTIPKVFADLDGVSYLGGHTFSKILHTERLATAKALAQDGKPNGTIFIPSITEQSIGGLMTFFMLATSVMGDLLDVNAYDQPGVEGGKKEIFSSLGRRGY